VQIALDIFQPFCDTPAPIRCPGEVARLAAFVGPMVACGRRGMVMVVKTTWLLSAVVAMLILLADVRPAVCEGGSIWNPFSSDSATEAKSKKNISKTSTKQPSTWDKVVAAPSNLLTKVGDTLTGKKSEPKKTSANMVAYPTPPAIQTKKPESKSWLDKMFQPKEPEKSKDVKDWLGKSRLDP
jgi:hypothetical protein